MINGQKTRTGAAPRASMHPSAPRAHPQQMPLNGYPRSIRVDFKVCFAAMRNAGWHD
jgi:hypothetical protein